MKTVLITGGARGIGAETAKLFSAKGYNVALNYLSSEAAAKKLAAETKNIRLYPCDVSNSDAVNTMTEKIFSDYGDIDVCVNNAAIAQYGLFSDLTDDDFSLALDVNVRGVMNVSRAVLGRMVSKKSGCIINISSMWGICGASCEVLYSTTKAAVIGFTKALAKELGPSGIRVNAVAPGFTATEMTKNISKEDTLAFCEETPLCRIAQPWEIAQSVYFLASDNAAFITGQVLSPNGGAVI